MCECASVRVCERESVDLRTAGAAASESASCPTNLATPMRVGVSNTRMSVSNTHVGVSNTLMGVSNNRVCVSNTRVCVSCTCGRGECLRTAGAAARESASCPMNLVQDVVHDVVQDVVQHVGFMVQGLGLRL